MNLVLPPGLKSALVNGWHSARALVPRERQRRRQVAADRLQADILFDHIGRDSAMCFDAMVLVDGTWDNANYWYRYSLLRSALGLSRGHEIGVIGSYSRGSVSATLARFGFEAVADAATLPLPRAEARRAARLLLAQTRQPADILRWRLRNGMPAAIVYDGILKRQRAATINLRDPNLISIVAEALQAIVAAEQIFDRYRPSLTVLSHAINFICGALAWESIRRGVPAVVAYGNYGVPRFWKLRVPDDLNDCVGSPTGADINSLSTEAAKKLARSGQHYLRARFSGQTDDIGARYAFQRRADAVDRDDLCRRFGWDPKKRIIAVYAANWFDFPHGCGMTHFADFMDWLHVTLDVASEVESVHWLFKAHPCDEWYGGVTLGDLMEECPRLHVRLAPEGWNGAAVMRAVDGVVTVHGTAGLEFASLGKPVLLADRGWYHNAGFALWPRSRDEYVSLLRNKWWELLDPSEQKRRANIFAGWYFGYPDWQADFLLGDDSEQDRLNRNYRTLLAGQSAALKREIDGIASWWRSPHRHYHAWKMGEAMA